jgi:hypothetical protein
MTSSRLGLGFLVSSVLALAAAGCGNYSNEDLEYMNALPENSDLRANIPPVTGAVELANEAPLARDTHDTTRGFNGLLVALVDIVDYVRSFPPTARTATSRTWGPFRNDPAKMKNLDWSTRMIVWRDDVHPDSQFDYEIDVHKDGNGDLDWPTLIQGWFQVGHTARRGVGHVELVTAAARAEGLDLTDLQMLDHLEIDYDTFDDPISVTMHITELPTPGSTDPAATATFVYKGNPGGQGEMTFDLVANLPMTGPAIEDLKVTSHWLSTGEGRANVMIVSGDGAGMQQIQCWDPSFKETYNHAAWAPGDDFPNMPAGDPPADCLAIPEL